MGEELEGGEVGPSLWAGVETGAAGKGPVDGAVPEAARERATRQDLAGFGILGSFSEP